ncbi:MAG: hypothetical protein E7172_03745 [Firmicutes bacterium]|nr:hypothetical protein [Bacillota bacterium]
MAIINIHFNGNLLYAPYILKNITSEKEMIQKFNLWLDDRFLKNSTWFQNNKDKNESIQLSPSIILKTYALSLSDHYWIKPKNKEIKWEDVNFFDNDFKENKFISLTTQERLYDYNNNFALYSPDITTGGELSKCWVIKDNKRVLYKGSNTFKALEPINEYLASLICEILKISYVKYEIEIISNLEKQHLVSSCPTFVTKDTELISASEIICFEHNSVDEAYQKYIELLNNLGVLNSIDKIQKMFLLDIIMANNDRHNKNFGLIRNVNNLKIIDVAPIFDTGNSLMTYLHDIDLDFKNEFIVLGYRNVSEQDLFKIIGNYYLTENQKEELLNIPYIYENLLKKYEKNIYINELERDKIVEKLKNNILLVINNSD